MGKMDETLEKLRDRSEGHREGKKMVGEEAVARAGGERGAPPLLPPVDCRHDDALCQGSPLQARPPPPRA